MVFQYAKKFSLHQQATLMTTGLVLVLYLGVAAAILLALAVLWLVARVVLLTMQTVTECAATVGAMYQASDPLLKFFILVAFGFVVYRVVTRLARR